MKMRMLRSLILFPVIACSLALAQSSSTTPLLNRIDGIVSGYSTSFPITGDFNNDGNLDFVIPTTVNSNGTSTPILSTSLGAGNGSVLSVVQTTLPVSLQLTLPNSGAVAGVEADFNDDKNMDIVMLGSVNASNPTVYNISFFAGNGDGTFKAPVSIPISSAEIPVQIQTADFNHDGRPDFAVLCQSGDLLVYIGNGDGTFKAPITSKVGVTSGGQWMQFAVGDINNDGFPDLLVSAAYSYATYTTSTMLGNGDGSFQAPVPVTQLPAQGSNNYQRFILADMNGDGKLDILADINNGAQVLFLAGNGNGTFKPSVVAVTLPAGFTDQSEGSAPAILDLNGDGVPDIVFGGTQSAGTSYLYTTLWAKGNGNGTFGTPVTLTSDGMTFGVSTVQLNSKTVAMYTPIVQGTSGGQGDSSIFIPTNQPAAIQISAAVQNFGNVLIGSADSNSSNCSNESIEVNCADSPLVITNRGTVPLSLATITTEAPFTLLNGCSTSLPVGQSCEVTAQFTPSAVGNEAVGLTVANGSVLSPFQVLLYGNGVTPNFSLLPNALTFTSQKVGTISNTQTLTLTNLTGTPQTYQSLRTLSNNSAFIENDNCQRLVVTSCTISIAFAPQATGVITGSVNVNDSNNNPVSASLTGTAYSIGPVLGVSQTSLSFGTPFVGTSVIPQIVTLTNTGDAPVVLTGVAAGTGFAFLNTCGSSLQPGASCEIGVFLDTSTTGTKAASLTITDNAPNSPQTVALSGTVSSVSVTPASGSSTSATLTHGGTATYNISVAPISGFTGTLAVACNNAPSSVTCTPSSTNITLAGSTPVNVTLTVKQTATASVLQKKSIFQGGSAALAICALIWIFPFSKRRRVSWFAFLFVGTLFIGFGCVGCGGGSSSQTTTTTPTSQNYTLNATFTAQNGGSVQIPLTLTVQN
jgi:hypothetical protein